MPKTTFIESAIHMNKVNEKPFYWKATPPKLKQTVNVFIISPASQPSR